jgi:hypothetical protein
MSRIAIHLITLGFFLSTGVLHAAETETAAGRAVETRATELYSVLLDKNARHFRVRDDLAPFFSSEEELNAFLVRLAKALDDKGIFTNRLESAKVEVLDADPSYGFAETRAHLEGDWILWFNRSIERTDRWKLIDGQWFVNPPPLANLELEDE